MILFRKVAIVGTGLIGGSLGLAIKKNKLADMIVGVSRRKESLEIAIKKGAIDQGSREFNLIDGADLVILAMPVDAIVRLAPKIAPFIASDCIVMDVGSTKERIVRRLKDIFPNFVGTHPLAGLEKRGVAFADAGLFKNSLCVITPTGKTNRKALGKIKALWGKLGVRITLLTPDMHDRVLSFVSHLAHIVSFSLINSVPEKHLKFAATGLKDTTRIAASDSELWAEIFLSNSGNLLKSINAFEKSLNGIKSAIRNKDKQKLILLLKQAKIKREKLG